MTAPVQRGGSPTDGPPSAQRQSGAGRDPSVLRVLLVQDDPPDTQRLLALLAECEDPRFLVDHAPSPARAHELLASARFHAVLVDLSLAESGGVDALLRAQAAGETAPVLALAPQADDERSLRALRLGVQDCLPKGRVDAPRLARALRHAVERHRLLSQLELARHREHYVATHDVLTGLPNRIHLQEALRRMLAHALRTGGQLAVLVIDLDRFKTINDGLGPSAGDELLRRVAERVCPIIRRSDMMARLGGDEFVIVLQGVENDYAPAQVASKVLERLSLPFALASGEHWVTASIGIASSPRDGEDVDALVRNADTAMNHAKAEGRNCYRFFHASMNVAVARRLALERGLRRALATADLELHYQPRIDVRTGRIVAAEALLRWADGAPGHVPLDELIPLAEETGLIVPVGEWVVAAACAQAKIWQRSGAPPIGVSVNVSAHEIREETLRQSVVQALWESGLEPRLLELEITESALMRDPRASLAVLKELKRVGVRVSLDDFGTGFSSLALLKSIPIDTVKIDRAFVCDVATDADDAAIVSAILAMAEQLGLAVVAEGVETARQRDFLRARGCHQMQGYLFSRPLAAEDFRKQLRSGEGRG